jgi:predicted DNA-binding transcriptional regulator YafY
MANTSSRTLRLLSLLQTHRFWPGEELAVRLEVSVRTLRRDIERLRELGYPVTACRGVDGGYQLAAGAVLPPLLLDDEEAVALAVALQTSADGAVAGIAESSLRALTKVVQVMPAALRRRVDAVRTATAVPSWGDSGPTGGSAGGTSIGTVDPETLVTVAQACRDSERLEFGYISASAARTERRVEPLRLVRLGRRWYLVGYDLSRQDWRTFRLDRLDRPRRTGSRFRPRRLPVDDPVEFVRAGLRGVATSYRAQALVAAPAERVRARVGRWATITDVDERSCRIEMHSDSLDWPAMALGSLGAEFTVIAPPELITHLADWSARFTRATT